MKSVVFITLLFMLACDSKPDIEWTKGGTLHKATIAEWNKADDKNKIATCADFVANIKKEKGETYSTVNEMKVDATDLKNCVDEAVKSKELNQNQSIAELAVMCKQVDK